MAVVVCVCVCKGEPMEGKGGRERGYKGACPCKKNVCPASSLNSFSFLFTDADQQVSLLQEATID